MAGKAPEDLPKRIALVHEWFTPRAVGGAEQVVQSIDALLLRLGSVSYTHLTLPTILLV